ncbi:MAG: ribonuclease III [Flavobacteriales bacterium]|nr:ribonuclease III [Flavobacteriales bacterium]
MRLFDKIKFKKSRSTRGGIFFDAIQKIIGFKPQDITFYERAFTHRSLSKVDGKGDPYNYERLEFLGDSVLGTIVAHYLFNEVPAENEGYLTKMRSKIVSRKHLNELGKELGLIDHIIKNDSVTQLSQNVHGNLFEALVGAILLDKGYSYCERFVYYRVIEPHVDIKRLEGKITSYKSLLIEWCQKNKKTFHFEFKEVQGNGNNKSFRVILLIDDNVVSKASGVSKKEAEEKAATRGYYALQNTIESN